MMDWKTTTRIETVTQMAAFIQHIACELEVPAPAISCTAKRKRSVYKHPTKEIAFSGDILSHYRAEEYAKYVAVHEVAHHVDKVRLDREKEAAGVPFPRRRSWHDRRFYKILLEVIDVAYSSRADYPWWREYKTIQNMAHVHKVQRVLAATNK